ncbi:MAG: PilN domain-containing protein [Candidatus Levyibacteriota bacterium]
MQKAVTINLAKGRAGSFVDRFLAWALTIGRVVVIVTEGVALAAFLYRFSLDRVLIDLHDKITQEEAVVNLLKDGEHTYRNLQDRLSLFSTVDTETNQITKVFHDMVKLVPADFLVSSISVAPDNVKIEATTRSVASLSTFIDSLRNYPLVTSVSLDKIENRTSLGIIDISVTATIKQTGGTNLL